MPAGIYTTNSAAQARTIADHARQGAFADTPEQSRKFIAEEDSAPASRGRVQMRKAAAGKTRLRFNTNPIRRR